MGGVWLLSAQHPLHPPYVWRVPFPASVQQALVSTDNLSGSITNSDLELAGTIAIEATLAMVHDLRHCTIATFSDNTPTVAWGNKASTTTASPASYLRRSSSLLQHQHWYLLHHRRSCKLPPSLLKSPPAPALVPVTPPPVLRVTSFAPQVSSSTSISTCCSGFISQGWPII